MGEAVRRRFEEPDETRELPNGVVELVSLAGARVGRSTFEPGWRWSESVKPLVKTDSCQAHHVGYAVSGVLHVVTNEGTEIEVSAGDVYEIFPGHEAWVVGNERFQGLEFDTATVTTYGKKE
jgi:quercetin dioxygenase-like cupin family protein